MDYASYLKLPDLLSLQELESAKHGRPAHDEHLFIVIHQTYELWFKQILTEIEKVQDIFDGDAVDDAEIGDAVHALDRIATVFRVLISQVDILETMTPMDFLEFRNLLFTASGFQSSQFRLIETRLGLPRSARLKYDDRAFDDRLGPREREAVAAAEARASLIDRLDRWLARTPFVNLGGFTFQQAYRNALDTMLNEERAILERQPHLAEEERAVQLSSLERARSMLDAILDEKRYAELKEKGEWRLSREALQAALFINLYRDEPALQLPFRLLSLLMDIDEAMATWRTRHALMAQRMIGRKVGTGGSSGHDYLRRSAEEHRIFTDLFALATFLLPRSALPALPAEVRAAMRYRYDAGALADGT